MSRYRIALVVNNLNVGGLEKVVISLLRGLDRNRYDVHLICLDGTGSLFDEVNIARERVLVLHKKEVNLGFINVDFGAIFAIRSFLAERNIQLLHAHNMAPLIYGGVAARSRVRGPLVLYTEHNQIYSSSPATKAKYPYYLKLADQVVVVSKDLKKHFRDVIGLRKPVSVIYNGIDGLRFSCVDASRTRDELGIASGVFLVGTAVVISEQKGIRYLMEAAKFVVNKNPEIHFIVAGDGPLLRELKDKLKTMGLGERFRFLGYRNDIPEIISALDLHVLPSLWEGFPLALLEAMAIGKPIVCSRVGGNLEIVEDGINGYLVAPRDAEGLAAKILMVAEDTVFLSMVQKRNREKFEQKFSERAMLKAHETCYDKMLASCWRK